jgi:hypothetical protein
MAASFNSLTFDEPGSRDYAAVGAQANVTAQVVPNQAPWIVTVSPDVARLTLPAQGTSDELDALRGAVGSLGDLIHVGGTWQAWLVEVRDVALVRDAAPYWRWSLELLILSGAPTPGLDALLTEDGLALTTEDGGLLLLEDA